MTMSPRHPNNKVLTTLQSSSSSTQLIPEPVIRSKPIGIRSCGFCFKFKSRASRKAFHQGLVLLLTFIAYAAFHMGRRPLSVVKNVLNQDCSRLHPKNSTNNTHWNDMTETLIGGQDHLSDFQQHDGNQIISTQQQPSLLQQHNHDNEGQPDSLYGHQLALAASDNLSGVVPNISFKDTSCDWAPFDDDATANRLLAYLDSAFLLSYAIFMFFSGFVADRMNLRHFISIGIILSGLGLIAFGLSYSLDIHSMTYFVLIQIISGAAQSTGWPVVVTCVSNWFDSAKLGTVYGLWNSHTNLGNILGATIAGFFVEHDWGLSFIVPGVSMILVGLVLFLFLVPTPDDVELEEVKEPKEEPKNNDNELGAGVFNNANQIQLYNGLKLDKLKSGGSSKQENHQSSGLASQTTTIEPSGDAVFLGVANTETSDLSQNKQPHQDQQRHKAISFMKALRIPGVIEYSFCLFFSKLVSYTFLYWLPRYITSSTTFNSEDSAYLSTPFDVGGIAGSILAGWLSDRFKVNGIICNIMLLLAIPSMFAYQQFGAYSSWHNILLQLLVGSLVNGPYCLITTAVSADLGNRIKDGHAMATVSAIIDGMGSVGAVLGPLFAGLVSSNDWHSVFLMLMIADVLAALCIIRVTVQDVRGKLLGTSSVEHNQSDAASTNAPKA